MSGTCIGLVSGGIDSPVAIARMAVAGWKIIPIHFSMEPVAGPEGEKKCIDLLLHLKSLEGGVGESVRQNLHKELVVVPVVDVVVPVVEVVVPVVDVAAITVMVPVTVAEVKDTESVSSISMSIVIA